MLLLTSSQIDEGSPEHTLVDGVIEMGEEMVGTSSVRHFKLRKTRGSGALAGSHEFEINDHGISIYPRLDSIFPLRAATEHIRFELITSGLSSLESYLGGGLIQSSLSLLIGPSGAGKTSLGLQFLAASTPDEPGLHFGFHESPQRIRLKSGVLGLGYQKLENERSLRIMWNPSAIGLIDRVAYELLEVVDRENIKRVFLDSLNGFGRVSADPSRIRSVIVALLEALRSRAVTVLATYELYHLMRPEAGYIAPDFVSTVDNLLLVEIGRESAELQRQLSILKTRDSTFDPSVLQLVMSDTGVMAKKGE